MKKIERVVRNVDIQELDCSFDELISLLQEIKKEIDDEGITDFRVSTDTFGCIQFNVFANMTEKEWAKHPSYLDSYEG